MKVFTDFSLTKIVSGSILAKSRIFIHHSSFFMVQLSALTRPEMSPGVQCTPTFPFLGLGETGKWKIPGNIQTPLLWLLSHLFTQGLGTIYLLPLLLAMSTTLRILFCCKAVYKRCIYYCKLYHCCCIPCTGITQQAGESDILPEMDRSRWYSRGPPKCRAPRDSIGDIGIRATLRDPLNVDIRCSRWKS